MPVFFIFFFKNSRIGTIRSWIKFWRKLFRISEEHPRLFFLRKENIIYINIPRLVTFYQPTNSQAHISQTNNTCEQSPNIPETIKYFYLLFPHWPLLIDLGWWRGHTITQWNLRLYYEEYLSYISIEISQFRSLFILCSGFGFGVGLA